MRSIIKKFGWLLRMVDPEAFRPVYSATCMKCSDSPKPGFDTSEEAQDWAIEHTARTVDRQGRHTNFMMIEGRAATVLPASQDAAPSVPQQPMGQRCMTR